MSDESALLLCQGCGIDLVGAGAEWTTNTVEAPPNPHFSGDSVKEVPALVCPECGEETPL